jgi:RNA polymerase sigma-70 factor (ECF subfamily)
MSNPDAGEALLERVRQGDDQALGELFMHYRERLWRMIESRLDRRLASRIAPDDVLQEAYLDVSRRIKEYLADASAPFYVWLRFLVLQRMLMMQRGHLGTQMRDVRQEVGLGQKDEGTTFATSESMAGMLVSDLTSPSEAAIRNERQMRLRGALDEMEPLDREVLALRHFEELGNDEVAHVLGISKDAASKRHVRALRRLKDIMALLPQTASG